MNRRECFPSFAARSCAIPHISDPKRNFFPLYLLLFVALAMMMQNNQDAAPHACTATNTASGVAIACNIPGLIQGATSDIFLCAAHAQRDATTAQKLKILQQRQRSVAQGAGAGAGAAIPPVIGSVVASTPPSIFNFDAAPPGSSPGSTHSFLRVPKAPSIPAGFGDNFDFAPHADTFPVANAILGGIKYEVAEVKKLLIAALRSDTSVAFPDMTSPCPWRSSLALQSVPIPS
jgi:hypothetical protein